jgi:hypothetical protein
MRNIPEMTDEDHDEIVEDIVAGLDPEDILAIPGVHEFICKHYADDIAERYAGRLLIAQEQAAEFQREIA